METIINDLVKCGFKKGSLCSEHSATNYKNCLDCGVYLAWLNEQAKAPNK
jgi:hypothetical protein